MSVDILDPSSWYSSERPLPFVYFTQSECGGPVKIGTTRNLTRRLEELQNGCPTKLVLLAKVYGDLSREQSFHDQFSEYRLHGEWFSPGPRLTILINLIIRGEVV